MIKAAVGAAIVVAMLASTVPSLADHGPISKACDLTTGYEHLTFAQLKALVALRIASGDLSAEHTTVIEWGVVTTNAAPLVLIEAGIVQEWAIDHNGFARHYLDPYWEYKFTHLPNWTFWEVGCASHPIATTTTTTTTTSTTTTTTTSTTTTTTAPPATTTTVPPTTTTIIPTTTPTVGLPLIDITINDIKLSCEIVT